MMQKERRNGDPGRRQSDAADVAHVLIEGATARLVRLAVRALWTLVTVLTVGGFSIGAWVVKAGETDKAILKATQQTSQAVAENQKAITAIAQELNGNTVHDADQDRRLDAHRQDIGELRRRRLQ